MSRTKKNGTERAKKAPPGAQAKEQNGALVEQLAAENEELKRRLKQVEEERDSYSAAVYAWARAQSTPEDFRRALDRDKDDIKVVVQFSAV